MRKFFSFLAGLVLGALVGAAAALLLAPYGGSELQEQIRERVQELIEEGRQAATLRQAELEEQLAAFKHGDSITIEKRP